MRAHARERLTEKNSRRDGERKKAKRKKTLLTGEQRVEGALRALHEKGARQQRLLEGRGGRREEHHVGHLLLMRVERKREKRRENRKGRESEFLLLFF